MSLFPEKRLELLDFGKGLSDISKELNKGLTPGGFLMALSFGALIMLTFMAVQSIALLLTQW